MQAWQRDPRVGRILIGESRLRQRVRELAHEIAADAQGIECLHVLTVLKGAFVFAADLGRHLRKASACPCVYEFIRARAYGMDTSNAGVSGRDVRLDAATAHLAGKDVLLVEDILDHGFTLARLREFLVETVRVRSLKLCVLIRKQLSEPSAVTLERRELVLPEYVGFDLPDVWVAGYGLDAAEQLRDLPCIVALRRETATAPSGQTGAAQVDAP